MCGLRMCADSRTPSYLAVFGWLAGGMLGRGTSAAVSITPLGSRSGGGSAGRSATAAGPGRSSWAVQLAISRTLCSAAVLGVVLPTVPDLAGKKNIIKI